MPIRTERSNRVYTPDNRARSEQGISPRLTRESEKNLKRALGGISFEMSRLVLRIYGVFGNSEGNVIGRYDIPLDKASERQNELAELAGRRYRGVLGLLTPEGLFVPLKDSGAEKTCPAG